MAFFTNRRLLTAVVVLALASAVACFGLLLRESANEIRIKALARRLEHLESRRIRSDITGDSQALPDQLDRIERELAAVNAGLAEVRAQSDALNQKIVRLETRRTAPGEAPHSSQQAQERTP